MCHRSIGAQWGAGTLQFWPIGTYATELISVEIVPDVCVSTRQKGISAFVEIPFWLFFLVEISFFHKYQCDEKLFNVLSGLFWRSRNSN